MSSFCAHIHQKKLKSGKPNKECRPGNQSLSPHKQKGDGIDPLGAEIFILKNPLVLL